MDGTAPIADIGAIPHKWPMRLALLAPLSASLISCSTPQATPTNADFSPPITRELVSGFELRDRYGLPRHIGGTAIYVDSVAVHHLREEASTIIWRDASGRWHRDQAIEIGPGGLLAVKRQLESDHSSILSEHDATALEKLIRDRSLYTGDVRTAGELSIGAPFHVMAIVSPYGRTVVRWDRRLVGVSGKVADVVLGRD